ncbi:hypothetical protein [Streptomyces sp. TRM68416]|uniref:hypothetical protein n=1 Tax=Streptomyces sp. TRM68416 TaxID=2758412 RepID=UPI001661E27C|nr:hypothetical protein [Streptomyces sp. TRM68416]MBD0837354.1 hypothetical protein [Streptomyces sp. TRM68416]
MKFCGRCGKQIKPDEEYTTHDIHSASGAGRTDYRHVAPCQPVPTQTAPVPRRH